MKLIVITQRCTGHCCREFPLGSHTIQELRDIAEDPNRVEREEAVNIVDMLVPLGEKPDKDGRVRPVTPAATSTRRPGIAGTTRGGRGCVATTRTTARASTWSARCVRSSVA